MAFMVTENRFSMEGYFNFQESRGKKVKSIGSIQKIDPIYSRKRCRVPYIFSICKNKSLNYQSIDYDVEVISYSLSNERNKKIKSIPSFLKVGFYLERMLLKGRSGGRKEW